MTGRQTDTLLTMAAGSAYQWALQTTTNNSDFELTDEERQATGVIVELTLTLGAGAAAKAGKVAQQLRVATRIFRQSASACDKISKLGRAMKSFREAGEVLAGKSSVQSSVRSILDNYCFVGEVDVTAYSTENRWSETPITTLAAAPVLLKPDATLRWIFAGVGAVVLLQAFLARPAAGRQPKEYEAAWPALTLA